MFCEYFYCFAGAFCLFFRLSVKDEQFDMKTHRGLQRYSEVVYGKGSFSYLRTWWKSFRNTLSATTLHFQNIVGYCINYHCCFQGGVFDLPNDFTEEVESVWRDSPTLTLQKAEELPELLEDSRSSFRSNGGGRFGQRGGGRGRSNFSRDRGGSGNFKAGYSSDRSNRGFKRGFSNSRGGAAGFKRRWEGGYWT